MHCPSFDCREIFIPFAMALNYNVNALDGYLETVGLKMTNSRI